MSDLIAQTAETSPVLLEANEATIYHRASFNYRRLEVRIVQVSTERYAQYRRALRVEFVEKGKRKRMFFQKSYQPEVVILRGHGHPVPADAMRDLGGGMSVSRATCHSPQWAEEFAEWLRPYLVEHPGVLLADYRGFDTEPR